MSFRELKLTALFNNLFVLPTDINRLIVQYDASIQYNTKPIQIWTCSYYPRGIIADHKQLYICDGDSISTSPLHLGTVSSKIIPHKCDLPLTEPTAIDIYENNLYISEKKNVSTFSFEFKLLSTFPIPNTNNYYTCLKVDKGDIYVTISDQHQILMYTGDGKLKNKIGSINSSSSNGKFNCPTGLYICDNWNHRIQALLKDKDRYLRAWGTEGGNNGQFYGPYSIYCNENILYIGDNICVQLFMCDGTFLQRIGGSKTGSDEGKFYLGRGICVVGDQLYVSDMWNQRIQVFGKV